MKKIYLLFLPFCICINIHAQNCGSTSISDIISLETEINGNINSKIINAYWHVVRTGSGELNNDISFYEDLIAETKAVFEDYSILLRTCNLNDGSEIYFDDSDLLYSSSEVPDICNFDDFCFEDGLNVFIVESDQLLGAASIRGNKCFVNVTDLQSSFPVICHEIGHCFGLFHVDGGRPMNIGTNTNGMVHNWKCDKQGSNFPGIRNTFHNCNNPSSSISRFWPIEMANGSNGGSSGDFVVDTPADLLFNFSLCDSNPYDNCSSDSESCDNLLDDKTRMDPECNTLSPDWFNYMRTATGANSILCYDHFTTGQVARMHGVITQFSSYMVLSEEPAPEIPCTLCWEGEDENPCLPCTSTPENQINITDNNSTWNQPTVHGEIVINYGSTLVINSTVVFTPASKIVVKSGGKLIVESGGLLTNCPEADKWQGVHLESPLAFYLNFTDPGIIEMKNGGTIENAVTGIDTRNTYYPLFPPNYSYEHGGGVINMDSGAKIDNCETGIHFARFGWGSVTGNGLYTDEQSVINNSFISNCDIGIYMDNNIGLEVNGTVFTDNYPDVEPHMSSFDFTGNTFHYGIEMFAEYPNFQGANIISNNFVGTYGVGSVLFMESQGNAEPIIFDKNSTFGFGMRIFGDAQFFATNNDFYDGEGIKAWESGDNQFNMVVDNAFYGNNMAVASME